MADLTRAIKDLVIANRILAHHDIVDAFGEISLRHPANPDRFLLARPLSPGMVTAADIVEFRLDGKPCGGEAELPAERFVHAAIYAARRDVKVVLHASPEDVLPFGITPTPLRPMIGSVGDMGMRVPVWDIAKKFGAATELRVTTMEQARDLARCLGRNRVALLRGMGFIVVGITLNDVVRRSVYIPRNARTIVAAKPFGRAKGLSAAEVALKSEIDPESNAMRRGWEYWARQAGCGELLSD